MTDDLFTENDAPRVESKKRSCLICGAPAPRPRILCPACTAAGTEALNRMRADVDAMELSWRRQLMTASEETQRRMVGVIRAQGEAYENGAPRERAKRIVAYKARLAATVRQGGELGSVAGMYQAWVTRCQEYTLVAVVVLMSGGAEEAV